MAKQAFVIGPVVPLLHHVSNRTSYRVGCAVQMLESGEVRVCVFPSRTGFPSIGVVFAIQEGEEILVMEKDDGFVEALPQVPEPTVS